MKKLLFVAFAMVSAMFVSCNDKETEYDYPNVFSFVTAHQIDSEDSEEKIYFSFDNGDTFFLSNEDIFKDVSEVEDEGRFVAGIKLEKTKNPSYDYVAKLYEIYPVSMGDFHEVATKEESDAIADHEFTNISTSISLTRGYLNLYAAYASEDSEDVTFALVENTSTTPDETKKGYLNLELRLDSAGDEGKGKEYVNYISFDMEPLRAKLEDKDGILLRIKTEKSDVITIKVEANELFEDEDSE